MLEDIPKVLRKTVEVIDSQIEAIDTKLEELGVKDLVDQQKRLRKAKAALLNTRGGSGGSNAQLTQEMVIDVYRAKKTNKLTVAEIAQATGVPDSTVRSHLNRLRDQRYTRKGDSWKLIESED